MFRKTIRRFIQEEFVPRQAQWRKQRRPDADAWTVAGKKGILLSDVPEEYGGGGGSFAHEAVVIEELAQAGITFGSAVHNTVAHYILSYGNAEQKRRWLPRMAQGELVGAIAMTEPAAGSDLHGIKTTAQRSGDRYIINGSKTFINNGWHAGLVVVAAKTDSGVASSKGLSLIAVETKDLRGYRVGRSLEKIGRNDQDTCELFFDGVSVPNSNLLGSREGMGLIQMMDQFIYERLTVAVSAVATAEQAVAITTKHAKERMVSGKPLMDFQNTRFKLAECKTEVHIARVFLNNCIDRFMAGQLDLVTAAMAKYWLTDCQGRIVDECVQLHGGYGYMAEHPIARMWADSRAQRIYAGTNEVMKELISWSL